MKVIIDENFLQLCGTGSLIGTILTQHYKEKELEEMKNGPEHLRHHQGVLIPGTIVLVFVQTSFSYRERNKGPKEFIIPEYAPMCLVEDILKLIGQGVVVQIEQEIVNS